MQINYWYLFKIKKCIFVKFFIDNYDEYSIQHIGGNFNGVFKLNQDGSKMKLKFDKIYDLAKEKPFYVSKYKC